MSLEQPSFVALERSVNAKWEHIRAARTQTEDTLTSLREALADEVFSDTLSIVLFGSLARREFNKGSDVDWTLLVDGQANPDHFATAQDIREKLKVAGYQEPGREGTFGSLAFSHELVHQIGGEDDTNRNTTRRVLLLLESVPLQPSDDTYAHARVVRSVLKRYIGEDRTFVAARSQHHVPRFLLNDLARYWRTMCVDFAYKARDRGGEGTALRNIKLRMSRKLLFVSGLLTCFGCVLGTLPRAVERGDPCDECAHAERCVACLAEALQSAPLDTVARTVLHLANSGQSPAALDNAKKIFDAYDGFLAILADESKRKSLKDLKRFEDDPLFEEARNLSHEFRDGLQDLFFKTNTTLTNLSQLYGVF